MGRSLRPTRRVPASEVGPGDVVLLRWPWVSSARWMLVDSVVQGVWTGRWVFGVDAGKWAAHAALDETYTVKDSRDAARDASRLELPRDPQV